MNSSIIVDGIGKAYRIGKNKSERFKEWFIPFYKGHSEPVWVLKDVSFQVGQGESVGIIGMNGAGKSTLLKIITGTTSPTTGQVTFNGRVAALLELGMGFHPDLSGRKNIALAGQLIGLHPHEIVQHMPGIEAFAEIGAAMDEPVRTYSSGMQMRLAFSLATAVRPDILIVDEALSVGDVYFQQKSFNRIAEFREQGTTLLFVSHDKAAVLRLCDRAILLKEGCAVMDGKPSEVMDYYNAMISEKQKDTIEISEEENVLKISSGNHKVRFTTVELRNANGDIAECIRTGELISIEASFVAEEDVDDAVFGFLIKERTGMEVFGTNTHHLGAQCSLRRGETCRARAQLIANLGPGIYSLTVALHKGYTHVEDNYHWIDLAATFTVVNADKPVFAGVAWLDTTVEISAEDA